MAKNFDVQSTDEEIVQNYHCAAKLSRNKEMSREYYMTELNRLGKTDLEVARLGFGAARIGESKSKTVVKSLLHSLRDIGITFIDTADCYAESEELIGTLLGSDLNDFVVATGVQHSVREFVEASATVLEMAIRWEGVGEDEKGYTDDGRCIVRIDRAYWRPAEVDALLGDAKKAREELGWQATVGFSDLVKEMVEKDLSDAKRDALTNQHGYKTFSRHE